MVEKVPFLIAKSVQLRYGEFKGNLLVRSNFTFISTIILDGGPLISNDSFDTDYGK